MTETYEAMAAQQAAGLRALAEFIEKHPEVADGLSHTLMTSGINMHLRAEDKAAELGQIARLAARAGATVDKEIDDVWHNLVVRFGAVKVHVLAYRGEVCERVVTGVQTVTRKVPDPKALAEVPEVEVAEEVERVEWVCRPLLDPEPPAQAVAS